MKRISESEIVPKVFVNTNHNSFLHDNSPLQKLSSPLFTRFTDNLSPAMVNHRDLLDGEFWRKTKAFEHIDEPTFNDYRWQGNNTITRPNQFYEFLGDSVSENFYHDLEEGYRKTPMSLRISPYLLSLIDWSDPYNCPIRTQFIPFQSDQTVCHPMLRLDTLNEQNDSPVPGLIHRYHDKALLHALDICPVYCRFCTRSYAIGTDTESIKKVKLSAYKVRWEKAFEYIANHPQIEDIVISGGDSYHLKPEQLEFIGMQLLKMPNIRRIRYATKGLAVMPQKIFSHHEWLDALTRVHEYGRKNQKSVVIHTHFNSAQEITWITQKAMQVLFERGITVRNQSVLLRGVNDDERSMILLVKRLGYINIQPYYVYICDMVRSIESLRTSVHTAVKIEKAVRGTTAGFNTPTFVCDAPGGGGKRTIHSYEYYNRETGVSVYMAPSVKRGQYFLYFDPLEDLSPEIQKKWQDRQGRETMIQDAIEQAKRLA